MHPAELAELEAFRDLYAVAPASLGARTAELGGALCIRLDADPRSGMFNRVLGLGLERPATGDALDRIVSFFGDGIGWAVALPPQAEPAELPAWLERRGFTSGYGWTKSTRAAGDAPEAATGLRVERVDEGRAFAEAFVRGYGTPDVFGDWVARLPGGRAGTASPRSTAPTQRVSGRSTSPAQSAGSESPRRPEHRRKGAQNAILAARIDAAAAVGCEVVATETGEPGGGEPGGSWRNIARAGFEAQYVRPNYLSGREDA